MGYSVGGKTGTAHKQEGKGYASKKYRSWFVGMAPIDNPRIVVAVMIDEPSDGKYFGGDVAAPVFSAGRAADPAHDGRAARHGRQAADRRAQAGRGGELLMAWQLLDSSPEAAARWLRGARARHAAHRQPPGAARATASSPGPGYAHRRPRASSPAALAAGAARLPGRGRRRRGLRLRRRRASPPAAA